MCMKNIFRFILILILPFSFLFIENDNGLIIEHKEKRKISNQVDLWVNVDEIDDGGVYFIRNAYNSDYVFDVPNSNYTEGISPIIYTSNGYANQRFVVHEETNYNGKKYYTITPLKKPDLSLMIQTVNENEELKLGKNNNSSLDSFLSNKFIIEKSTYGYLISSGISTFGKYIIPCNNQVIQGNTLCQKTISNIANNPIYQWEFCKTDSLGVDLQNKIEIKGKSVQYFNLIPPTIGEYIIETQICGDSMVDTYLELYSTDGELISYNDDISQIDRNSRIIYNFPNTDNVQVRVRGYSNFSNGYVYLTLRPKNALYFAGVYDFDKNNNDRPSSLNNIKPYFPNYHIEVQANRGKNAILETTPNGKKKINCEYFVFSGHGYSNVAGVEFYNCTQSEGFGWNEIPDLNDTKIAIWMSCHGARNYFTGNEEELTSMAYQSIKKGANYSLGYVGEIYDTTQRAFPENFFEAINSGLSIPDAINQATEWVKSDNWWYWTFFGQFNDDFNNPILYKKGDSIKTECGNGDYSNNKKKINKKSNEIIINNSDSKLVTNVNIRELKDSSVLKFVTTFEGKNVTLGFECDEYNHIKYYNYSLKQEISSEVFEKMMGKPTRKINELVSRLKSIEYLSNK